MLDFSFVHKNHVHTINVSHRVEWLSHVLYWYFRKRQCSHYLGIMFLIETMISVSQYVFIRSNYI